MNETLVYDLACKLAGAEEELARAEEILQEIQNSTAYEHLDIVEAMEIHERIEQVRHILIQPLPPAFKAANDWEQKYLDDADAAADRASW